MSKCNKLIIQFNSDVFLVWTTLTSLLSAADNLDEPVTLLVVVYCLFRLRLSAGWL